MCLPIGKRDPILGRSESSTGQGSSWRRDGNFQIASGPRVVFQGFFLLFFTREFFQTMMYQESVGSQSFKGHALNDILVCCDFAVAFLGNGNGSGGRVSSQ